MGDCCKDGEICASALRASGQAGDNVGGGVFPSSVPTGTTSLRMLRRMLISGLEKLVPLLRIVDVV